MGAILSQISSTLARAIMPRAKRLNKEDITPAKLREFEGFEDITDREAEMICEFTIQYCSIVQETFQLKKQRSYDSKNDTKRLSEIRQRE